MESASLGDSTRPRPEWPEWPLESREGEKNPPNARRSHDWWTGPVRFANMVTSSTARSPVRSVRSLLVTMPGAPSSFLLQARQEVNR